MKQNEMLISFGFPTMETILALEKEGFFKAANCKFGVGENFGTKVQSSIEYVKLAPIFSEIWDVLPNNLYSNGTHYFKDLGSFHIAYKSEELTLVGMPIKGNICETAAMLWLYLKKEGYID